MSNFNLPVKAAFGRYLQRFHADMVGDNKFVAEFAARDFSKAAVWAPDRMIDQVEEMLATWRKNDTAQADKATPFLPVMIVAMSKDYVPVTPDFARQAADPVMVTLPNDPKGRVFSLRVAVAEVRAQVVIVGPELGTCRSIAMQLQLFCAAMHNRRFYSTYELAGFNEPWPVTLETPDIAAISAPNDAKNMTVLAVDFTLRATIPLLKHPKATDSDADNKGTNETTDPDGYQTVQEARGFHHYDDAIPDPITFTEKTSE